MERFEVFKKEPNIMEEIKYINRRLFKFSVFSANIIKNRRFCIPECIKPFVLFDDFFKCKFFIEKWFPANFCWKDIDAKSFRKFIKASLTTLKLYFSFKYFPFVLVFSFPLSANSNKCFNYVISLQILSILINLS